MNSEGKEITPIKYDEGLIFQEGFSPVLLNGKWGYVNSIESWTDEVIAVVINDKSALIDITGKQLTPFKYDLISKFYDGCAVVRIGEKYGFINTNGKEIIKVNYVSIADFNDGFAALSKDDIKWMYINTKGKAITPVKYEHVAPFNNEMALVGIGDKYGFINTKGEEAIPLIYDYAESFDSDGYALVILNGESFYINMKGEKLNISLD